MNIPRYWAKAFESTLDGDGNTLSIGCYRWSNDSLQDAQHLAAQHAASLIRKFALVNGVQQNDFTRLQQYQYGDNRPLREEIVQELIDADGEMQAVITRNTYGALVLNTSKVMFIDLDFTQKHPPNALMTGLQRLFGRTSPQPTQEDLVLQRVKGWIAQFPELGMRIYRTAAGMRGVITTQLYDPTQPNDLKILHDLKSDPLYIRLCKAQACFRARLTPKPWRIEINLPPTTYPWFNTAEEANFRGWQQRYEQKIKQFTTCRFVEQLGSATVLPAIKPILDLHDQIACAHPTLKLA